jgi:6,7-dimethyl-8-ribityllumazine synthase
MAEADLVALPAGALDDVAARVGASLHGSADGTGLRIGIACAEFNGGITLRLLDGALGALDHAGSDRRDVIVAWAPGAFELPLVARAFAHAGKVDAVLCLGAVIRGDTGHYDFVAGECALEQALVRSLPDESNKGREAALTGIEMVRLLRSGPLS